MSASGLIAAEKTQADLFGAHAGSCEEGLVLFLQSPSAFE
jgi:hypothetical protein